MAIVSVLFKTLVRIGVGATEEELPVGAIQLDASIEETHVSTSVVTEFPVEQGVNISDHVRAQPVILSIRGIITDQPLGLEARPLESDRSLKIYDVLLKMKEKADLVSVVTSLRQYSNMAIENITVPRNALLGSAVEVSISFREVFTAQVAVTEGTTDLGTQNTSATT